MESIGEKLKTKRAELSLSIEQIARETNIAKRYILALEEEDFEVFPGEPYLIGFLRTYSESLGLVPEEIIALYKNFRIQEQPLPMTELLQDRSRTPYLLFIIIGIAAVLGVGGYFLIPPLIQRIQNREVVKEKEEPVKEMITGVSYTMDDEILERRFFEGDEILVVLEDQEYPVLLFGVGKELTLQLLDGSVTLDLGEEKLVDLDGDDREDIKIFLRDLDANGEKKSVIVRFDRFTQEKTVFTGTTGTAGEEPDQVFADIGPGVEASIPAIGSSSIASRKQKIITITQAFSPEPITVDIIFRGFCLLRYVSDNQRREERYFHKGETFRLEAGREVMLWISNAGSFKARVFGEDIDLGRPGAIATKLIKWVEVEQSGGYELQIIPLY